MIIDELTVGMVQTRCYILSPEAGQECIVIDPGDEASRILKAAGNRKIAATNPVLNAGMGLMGCEITAPQATDLVREGDELTLAGLKIQVLHTPGHTPGSVCYLIEGELFTGDTLFDYGWGRTDLPGGNEEQMEDSLRRLMPMVRSIPMHAGH